MSEHSLADVNQGAHKVLRESSHRLRPRVCHAGIGHNLVLARHALRLELAEHDQIESMEGSPAHNFALRRFGRHASEERDILDFSQSPFPRAQPTLRSEVVSNGLDGGLVARGIGSTQMEIFDEDDQFVVVGRAQSFLRFMFAVSPFEHALDAVFELNRVALKRQGHVFCAQSLGELEDVLEQQLAQYRTLTTAGRTYYE